MEYTENHYKGMRTKVIIFIIITLFSMIRAFCKENSNGDYYNGCDKMAKRDDQVC